MSCKKALLKFQKVHREIPALQSLSNTVKGLHDVRFANLLKRDLCTGVSEPGVGRSSTT